MAESASWLDGNGVAGLLSEVFETEMTTVDRGCGTCGGHHAVGAHRAYRGAGTVLRCPGCGDVAVCAVVTPERTVVRLAGTWSLPHA